MKADKTAEDYLAHNDGNVFEQVRRKMTDDPNNRWDHTRAIGGPK